MLNDNQGKERALVSKFKLLVDSNDLQIGTLDCIFLLVVNSLTKYTTYTSKLYLACSPSSLDGTIFILAVYGA